jgi:signal transduction histidine kinase/DNA-binding response OmpR family regulator
MADTPASLLIVDSDREFARMLAGEARARGYRVESAVSVKSALDLVRRDLFDALLVDLAQGADSAFELLSEIRQLSSDTEVIVMSDRTSLAGMIQWFDPDAFACVRKADVGQLFASLAGALERRRITAQNRRLVWELQTINEIASGVSRSLELTDILTSALQRLVRAMDGAAASIRLYDRVSDRFEDRAAVGAEVEQLWTQYLPGVPRPSDLVIANRAAVTIEDFADQADVDPRDLPLRSALSVPMFAGDELVGTLSIGSTRPRRFQSADEHLVRVIAAQIVVAVQNAQLHHSIRQAKREWERTFDAIGDQIALFNDRGKLLRGNRALGVHLDLPVTGLTELTCREVGFCGCGDDQPAARGPGPATCRPDGGPRTADPGNAGPCAVSRALAQETTRAEITLPDGQIFSVTTFPIGPASDGPSVVQIAKNVTEEIASARRLQRMSQELATTNGRLVATLDQLKATQAQLVQAEKLSAIGQLVAGVAHELNNPLTSVIGYAQLVEEELRAGPSPRPAEDVAQDLRRIAEESERAARIVRNLLTFARRQGAARAPQDVVDVCQRVIALREYSLRIAGVELTTSFASRLPKVLADGGQLQQVLLNLVLNAEQAMRNAEQRRLAIAVRHDALTSAVELRVSDSGHGIESANLSRIFDPFFTTREVGEGTGLGLSICYGIVRDHGGQITVESRPHEGTTFTVLLPARQSGVITDGDVLVAHPEQAEREFITAALRGWGYRPLPAATSHEATELWPRESWLFAIVDRSIVSTDLEGWHDRSRARDDRSVPLIVTSIVADTSQIHQSGGEAAAILAAPVSLGALNAAVQTVTRLDTVSRP